MREIVHLQIGECGNRIGRSFWEEILRDHGLRNDECMTREELQLRSQRTNVYFVEGEGNRYVPRAILVDLDCRSIHKALNPPHNQLFNVDNIIIGRTNANGNWAKAYYKEGAEIKEKILERVRIEAEACDCIQGIQIVHALSGGTGSGLGSLLAPSLTREYPKKILKSYSVMPTMKKLNGIIEVYNTILTIPYLIDIDETFCMDNEAISRSLILSENYYYNINRLISFVMSDVTACLRFPGQLNADLRNLLVNMVPFPSLHFLVPGHVPRNILEYTRKSFCCPPEIHARYIKKLVQQMFDATSMFFDCDPRTGKFITAAAIFRGRGISPKIVNEEMLTIQNKAKTVQDSPSFVKWLASNIKTAICNVAPLHEWHPRACATWLSNTSAILEPFNELSNKFQSIFRRKPHLHYYTNEGMEESQFLDSLNKLQSLISAYKKYQDASAETNIVEELMSY